MIAMKTRMRWNSTEPFPPALTLVAGSSNVEAEYVALGEVLDVLKALGMRPTVLERVEQELAAR